MLKKMLLMTMVKMITMTERTKAFKRNIKDELFRQTDRKTERLFSLVIKTKVVKNVNRMSEK